MKTIIYLLFICCIWLLCPRNSTAEITLDGSVGAAVTLEGNDMELPAELGSLVGNNLFHSLRTFKLEAGQSLTLTGPAEVLNVIARVTGIEPTLLDGKLSSTIPAASIYLLSPNGIIIGENAELDLPAGLHLSSANTLVFQDGQQFTADLSAGSVLSSAEPSQFGFLTDHPITLLIQNANLQMAPQAQLSFIGGDVAIQNSTITAPNGTVNIVALAGQGQVDLASLRGEQAALGIVQVVQTDINSSGSQGGRIWLQGGQVVISEASLSTRVENTDTLAETSQPRQGTGLYITADDLSIQRGSILDSSTLTDNPSGRVEIIANNSITLYNQSRIANTVGDGFHTASGQGGDILIQTPKFSLTGGSVIQTGAGAFLQNNSGDAGSIYIAANDIRLTNRSSLITSTLSDGQGGYIVLTADHLLLDNAGITASSLGTGRTGRVEIHTNTLEMQNISVISTRSLASGGGDIWLDVKNHLFSFDSAVTASARGLQPEDAGGNLLVTWPTFLIMENSEFLASALVGNGGNILLEADYFLVNQATIDASSVLGIDGEIRIDSPIVDIGSGLTVLPQHYADASRFIDKRCAERLGDDLSSLVVLPYEVLPISPYGVRGSGQLAVVEHALSVEGAVFLPCQ